MYTLRTITQTGKQTNRLLGEVYTYVGEREASADFDLISKEAFNDLERENIFAYVLTSSGEAFPLYKGNKYYVVSPNGQTFSNLSNY